MKIKHMTFTLEELITLFKQYERYLEGDSMDALEWRNEYLNFIMYITNIKLK